MEAILQLRLLGVPEIVANGLPMTEKLPGKAQAILYYLAMAGQPQSRTTLATLLWGDMPESDARMNLRKALGSLRQELDAYLQIERQAVAFKLEIKLEVDALEFEAGLNAAASPVDVGRLQAAADLYQGDFLAGFYVRNALDFETWMYTEQGRLRELMIQALRTMATHFTDHGDLGRGITTVRRLLNLEPWREEAHCQLMLLLAQEGQRAAALAQYETCRQMLAEELGVEPGRETVALYERIRDGELSRGAGGQGSKGAGEQGSRGENFTSAPPPPSPSTPLHNLPQQPTSFIGREKELAEIRRLLLDEPACRLLTLVGPGGIGKTRLALAAAVEVVDAFPQGVYFVPLMPVSQAEFIVSAVADALNFNFSGGMAPKTQLLNHLRGQRLLLVLDNFEHLLAPVLTSSENERASEVPDEAEVENGLELLPQILNAAPGVTLLVTSRERLKLQEEWGYEVRGMEYPKLGDGEMGRLEERSFTENDPDLHYPKDTMSLISNLESYSAVHLFVQRARRAEAGFNLTAEDMPHIARICQLVEGMPLALELAAPWVRLMTCREIAQEIEHNLDFLTTTLRNVPNRHRSLRVVLAQTWQRLPAAEQLVLSKLSVFKGGCRREAAEQVAGASLPVLISLVDKALLRRTQRGRYELHELLRQFAAEKLQNIFSLTEATQAAHAHYYGDFLQKQEGNLKGARQLEALAEIAAEIDNVRTSWHWAVDRTDLAVIKKSLESLFFFCDMQGQAQEGVRAFRRAVVAFREPDLIKGGITTQEHKYVLGQLIGRQGFLSIRLGPDAPTIELMRESVSLLRQVGPEARGQLAFSLHYLGQETYLQGEPAEAIQLLQESLDLATEVNEYWVMGGALQMLGQTAEFQGDFARAEPFFQKSIHVYEKIGELRDKAFALNNWGRAAYAMGKYAQAEQLLKKALKIRQEVGDLTGIAYSFIDLGKLALMQGEVVEGQQFMQGALVISKDANNHDQMARCYNGLGIICRLLGDLDQAEVHHQTSLAIFDEIKIRRETPFTLNNLGYVAYDQGAYQRAEQRFQESLNVSKALENKGETASALRYLGHVTRMMGRDSEARQYYRQALEIVIKTGAAPVALDIFLGWAGLLRRSNPIQAVELLTFVQHHPAATYETRENARRRLLEVAAELPPEVIAQAQNQDQPLDWQAAANRLIQERSNLGY